MWGAGIQCTTHIRGMGYVDPGCHMWQTPMFPSVHSMFWVGGGNHERGGLGRGVAPVQRGTVVSALIRSRKATFLLRNAATVP